MTLFNWGQFTLASGKESNFKIDCDALSNDDIDAIVDKIGPRLPHFKAVYGVPRGGLRLAQSLQKYVKQQGTILIVDDVYTTGKSINNFVDDLIISKVIHDKNECFGIVLFARREITTKDWGWIAPVFQLHGWFQ